MKPALVILHHEHVDQYVIEWGKDFVSTLTDQYLEINIERGQKDDQRQVEFVMVGDRWDNFKL